MIYSPTCGRHAAAILIALALAFPALSWAAPVTLGSDAEVWLQQTDAEKAAYLDGMCRGLNAAGHLAGELMCSPKPSMRPGQIQHTPRSGWRFCAIRFGGRRDVKGLLRSGSEILDAFYANPAHTDVPVSLAIEQYNDQACHETNVGRRLVAAQAKRKCGRQLINMHDVSTEARAAQQAACDRLK
jgi:hypothetical protein